MDYKKPQSTLVQGSVGIYPLTTADQVILADGSRLEKDGNVQADMLGGKTLAEIMLALYPVGAVYISVNNTSPASLFGGTWEQLQDRFLLAAGSTYSAGSTGGEATHTLTINEIPAHRHNHPNGAHTFGWANTSANNYIHANMSSTGSASNPSTFAGDNNYTNDAGGGGAHNNMPPYLVVYMWKRVS